MWARSRNPEGPQGTCVCRRLARDGGRYRIRTYDFHRVNQGRTSTFNTLHGMGRNQKPLKTQLAHNKASPFVR